MKRAQVIVIQQNNQQEQPIGFVAAFITFILICMFWKWVLVFLGSIAAAFLVICLVKAVQKDLREQAELDEQLRQRDEQLRQRADQQHAWYCAGDPRGTYGEGYVDEGLDR